MIGTDLLLLTIPPDNPGYIASLPVPLYTLDTSLATYTYSFSTTSASSLWIFAFNFRQHPLCVLGKNYVTGVSFVNLTGPDTNMQALTYSNYNGIIGVVVSGGTVGQSYDLVVGATLSNSQVVSSTIVINLKI